MKQHRDSCFLYESVGFTGGRGKGRVVSGFILLNLYFSLPLTPQLPLTPVGEPWFPPLSMPESSLPLPSPLTSPLIHWNPSCFRKFARAVGEVNSASWQVCKAFCDIVDLEAPIIGDLLFCSKVALQVEIGWQGLSLGRIYSPYIKLFF